MLGMAPSRRARVTLTEAQIAEAAAAHENGASLRDLGDRYGVHFSTLSKAFSRLEAKDSTPMPPPGRTYRDLPAVGNRVWDSVGVVRAALNQLEEGQFEQAALMVDAMMADDRISGVWSCRADGVVGLPLEMRTPKGLEGDARAVSICQDAEANWQTMAPEQSIAELLKWGRLLGAGLAEKVYPVGSPNWSREMALKVWHPRFLTFSWQTRTFQLLTESDGLVSLDFSDPSVRRKWVLYAPYGVQRGWANARVKALAIPWIIRQWSYRDWSRHNEVHGLPIRKVKVPAVWDDAEKKRAMTELSRLASESVVRCPVDAEGKGFDLELVEPKGNSFEAFDRLLARADTAIAVVLLGQNLTTEVQGGSRAASQVHERVRQDVIKSDTETLSTCLRCGVMEDWTEFNHGDRTLAPWPTYNTRPPRDQMQEATALRAFMEAVKESRLAGLPVDLPALCERYGIPLDKAMEMEKWEPVEVRVAKIKAESAKEAPPLRAAMLSAKADVTPGMVRGQAYTDRLKDTLEADAVPAMSSLMRALLTAIEGAESYEDVRAKVLAAWAAEKSPAELAGLVEQAVLLAELNGVLSVREDEP